MMKNCRTCLHARRAGNIEMAGCKMWTEIYRGNKKAVTAALRDINKKQNLGIDMDRAYPGREGLSELIDVLIKEYAPQPVFEGWVDLEVSFGDFEKKGNLTNFCVLTDPYRFCCFYEGKGEQRIK